jgi:uncharacterized membrane protein
MSDPTLPPQPPVPGRGLRIALFVSVALNLCIIGLVGGALWHGRPEGGPRFARDLGFGPFTEALSPEDRRALVREFGRGEGGARAFRREMRADMETLLGLLRADPLDRDALGVLFARMAERGQERLETGQGLIEERILAMPPEARRAFADRLEAVLRRGPGGDGRKDAAGD